MGGRERIDGEEKSRRERIYFRMELSYLQRYFWITMFFMLMVETGCVADTVSLFDSCWYLSGARCRRGERKVS